MNTSATHHSDSLIESASALLRQKAATANQSAKVSVLPKHEQAMARRLAQLNAALSVPEAVSKPEMSPEPATAQRPTTRVFGIGSLVLVSACSTLAGAGLALWLDAPRSAPPRPPTISSVPPPAAPIVAIAAPQSSPVIAVETPEAAERQQVGELITTWRTAWAERNAGAYLSTYGKDFTPADGSTHQTWTASRTRKLGPGPQINLAVNDLHIERVAPNQFKASFRQDYSAGNYREVGTEKTLIISREGTDWRITQERQD